MFDVKCRLAPIVAALLALVVAALLLWATFQFLVP